MRSFFKYSYSWPYILPITESPPPPRIPPLDQPIACRYTLPLFSLQIGDLSASLCVHSASVFRPIHGRPSSVTTPFPRWPPTPMNHVVMPPCVPPCRLCWLTCGPHRSMQFLLLQTQTSKIAILPTPREWIKWSGLWVLSHFHDSSLRSLLEGVSIYI